MSAAAPTPAGRGDRWLVGGWILAVAVTLAGTVHDTDPYWQIRAGQEVLDGTPLARPDSWSWAPVDGLFYPNSPAWNVLLATAWDRLGSWGLYLVTVAGIALTLWLTALVARRLGARAVQIVAVLLLTSAAILPILSPRPAVAAQALFLLAVLFAVHWIVRARGHGLVVNATVALVAGFLFSWIGNWIHLSWSTLAMATALVWAVVWLLTRGPALGTRVAMVVAGSLGLAAGVLLGPYGVNVFERSNAVLAACRDLIYEWTSPFTTEMGLRWWPLAVIVAASTILILWWCLVTFRRRRDDPRLPLTAALALGAIPYAVGGFLFIRFIPVALLTLAPVAAAALTAGADRAATRFADPPADARYLRRRLPDWTSDRFWRVILWGVLVLLAPLALFAGSRHAEPATEGVNEALPRGCRMFGGSLESASIILTRPDVKIWIDGRADYWGRERLIESHGYIYAVDRPTLVPPGTTCIVLGDPATDAGLRTLTDALDADPSWRRVPGTVNANLWVPAP